MTLIRSRDPINQLGARMKAAMESWPNSSSTLATCAKNVMRMFQSSSSSPCSRLSRCGEGRDFYAHSVPQKKAREGTLAHHAKARNIDLNATLVGDIARKTEVFCGADLAGLVADILDFSKRSACCDTWVTVDHKGRAQGIGGRKQPHDPGQRRRRNGVRTHLRAWAEGDNKPATSSINTFERRTEETAHDVSYF